MSQKRQKSSETSAHVPRGRSGGSEAYSSSLRSRSLDVRCDWFERRRGEC